MKIYSNIILQYNLPPRSLTHQSFDPGGYKREADQNWPCIYYNSQWLANSGPCHQNYCYSITDPISLNRTINSTSTSTVKSQHTILLDTSRDDTVCPNTDLAYIIMFMISGPCHKNYRWYLFLVIRITADNIWSLSSELPLMISNSCHQNYRWWYLVPVIRITAIITDRSPNQSEPYNRYINSKMSTYNLIGHF